MPADLNALRNFTVILDRGSFGVGTYDNSQAFIDGLRQDVVGLDVLNNAGQVIGAISSINPVTSIFGNTLALSITLNKAINDGFTLGDALSIAGNVVAIVGAATVVGAVAANPFTVFGLTAAGLSIGLTQLSINEAIRNKAISPTLGTTPDPLVKTIKYVPWSDPLVLDLDGDGLEITPLSAGVLFDTNADTIKTGTAWVGADDGILVRDLNGNGVIDSGRELFGDEMILTTGPNAGQKASHGFTPLADLDSNLDGKFDALDAQFANVRVWKDLNQDGVSQAGELKAPQQSVFRMPYNPSSQKSESRCAKSGSSHRAQQHQCRCDAGRTRTTNPLATNPKPRASRGWQDPVVFQEQHVFPQPQLQTATL